MNGMNQPYIANVNQRQPSGLEGIAGIPGNLMLELAKVLGAFLQPFGELLFGKTEEPYILARREQARQGVEQQPQQRQRLDPATWAQKYPALQGAIAGKGAGFAQKYPDLYAAMQAKAAQGEKEETPSAYETYRSWPQKYPELQAALANQLRGAISPEAGWAQKYPALQSAIETRRTATPAVPREERWARDYPALQRAIQGAPQELKNDVNAAIRHGVSPREILR